MAEYIEREAAIKTVVEAVDNGLATTSEYLREILEELPAADVEPVRHARWKTEYFENKRLMGYRCTAPDCGVLSCCQADRCPNCGAKMDRKENT